MKTWRNISFVLALSLLSVLGAKAQVQFVAKSNYTSVGRNEQFKVTFTINAMGSGFKAPDFSNFIVLQGPLSSRRNVRTLRSVEQVTSFTYVLRPRQLGNYTIGSAKIEAKSKTFKTKPFTVKVLKNSPRGDDPNDPYNIAARSAFIKVFPSKTTVYQGEPLVCAYKLFYKTNYGTPILQSTPDFSGFYHTKIEPKGIRPKTETYKGQKYKSGVIAQEILIPQRSGSLKPGQAEFYLPTQIYIRQGGFRMPQVINQTSIAQFPKITVKPLPEEGKPSDFSGAVGQYKFSVKASRSEVPATESVTLRISLSGKGNIKLVDAPAPELPSAFEIYDPELKEKIAVNGAGMSGSKTYDYLLIPRYGGTYKIPAISFTYFDPESKRYKTLQSEEIEITVTGGSAQPDSDGTIAGGETEKVGFIGSDILFIKTDTGRFTKKGQSFLDSSVFYAGMGFGGISLAGMFTYFLLVSNRKRDQNQVRQQKASKLARKHLSQAKKELDQNNKDGFYLALTSALWGYFSDKFSIPNSKLSKELIEETLLEKGLNSETRTRVSEMMNRAEMARFTSTTSFNVQEDYDETALLITQIEAEL